MIIGNKEFKLNEKPYVMGILNVTPDSFSDGGTHNKFDDALYATEQMINDGADIIDVGGESTRPGYTLISDEEEIGRVVPVIEAIRERFDTVISLDTYKAGVAEAGIRAGADLINDIWGFKWDGRMADIVAAHDVACCLMHNRRVMDYTDYLNDVVKDLDESVQMALNAGRSGNRICKELRTESRFNESSGAFAQMGFSDTAGYFQKIYDRSDSRASCYREGRRYDRDIGHGAYEGLSVLPCA